VGFAIDLAEAGPPDGRPVGEEGEALVLAPYQHAWVWDGV
jgi:hypothetical protein